MSKPVSDRRLTFNTVAGLYHAARPCYPAELMASLVRGAGLGEGSRLCEIGPGTGLATEPLARLGCEITAIELGEDLAREARRNLASFPGVRVITGAFEEAGLADEYFDLVYSATAFHWIAPEAKFAEPYRILRPRGHLAIIGTSHVSDEAGDYFFHATQPLYSQFRPGGDQDGTYRLPLAADLKPEPVDTRLFEPVCFEKFPVAIPYSAAEYANLLNTYSPVLSMAADQRAAFLQAIADLIDASFGGSVVKNYVFTLTLARKE